MKTVLKLLELVFFTAYTVMFFGCKKEAESLTLTTTAVSMISVTTATTGGNIISSGGVEVTARGVCWSTTQDPTTTNNKTNDGIGSGVFSSNLSGLAANTTYYVRAYATNSSGTNYGDQLSFTTEKEVSTSTFNNDLTYGTISDIEGNSYKTVQIGSQTWMAENLRTTKLNDGESIPLVTENANWNTTFSPGYCWYNNDLSYKETYGALYNWFAATDSRNICPTGWHVPSADEWTTLATYLGGSGAAGAKMKEAGTDHWLAPNTGANNSSGMTGLPGGGRREDGLFMNIHFISVWWTTSISNDGGLPVAAYTNADIANFYLPDYLTMKMGCSVRCLKD